MTSVTFLVEPPEAADIACQFGWTRHLPVLMVEGVLRKVPPIKVASTRRAELPWGGFLVHFVSVPLTAGQRLMQSEENTIRHLIQAGNRTKKLGAVRVGMDFPPLLAEKATQILQSSFAFTVTSGIAYGLAMALEAVKKAAPMMGHSLKNSRTVILGAAQPMGSIFAMDLAKESRKMTLVDTDIRKTEEMARKIFFESGLSVSISTDIKKVLETADIIIVGGRMEGLAMEAEQIPTGSIVCEFAGPICASSSLSEYRDDILVMEGGVVELPSKDWLPSYRGFPQGHVSPAMAEILMGTLEGQGMVTSSKGSLTLKQVEQISVLAKKNGFRLSGFKRNHRMLTASEIEKVTAHSLNKKRVTPCDHYLDRIIS